MPANEVFLTSSKSGNAQNTRGNLSKVDQGQIDKLTGKGDQSGTKKRALHIKRFDPSNPASFALVVKKEEKSDKMTEKQEK